MSRQSKLYNAKQKITQLREKYSKNNAVVKSDFVIPSSLSNDNPTLEESYDELTTGFFQDIESEMKFNVSDNDQEKQNNGYNNINTVMNSNKKQAEYILREHSQNSSIKEKCSNSVQNLYREEYNKSESTLISDLPLELDHICFVSSSSNDSEIDLNELKTDNSVFERSNANSRFDKHKGSVSSNSVNSVIHSEINYKISSVTEIPLILEQDYIGQSKKVIDGIDLKCDKNEDSYDSDNSEIKTFGSTSEQHDLKYFNDSNVHLDDGNKKKSKIVEIKTEQLAKLSSDDYCTIRPIPELVASKDNNCKQTSEVKSLNGINHIKKSQFTKKGSRHNDKQTNYAVGHLRNKTLETNRNNMFKGSVKCKATLKRPMLKSCELIKCNESKKKEFEELVQCAVPLLRFNITDNNLYDKRPTGYCCDDVIRQLLKSQIQLTRHFIESHHEMYLHCCQAVQLLSKMYTSNND